MLTLRSYEVAVCLCAIANPGSANMTTARPIEAPRKNRTPRSCACLLRLGFFMAVTQCKTGDAPDGGRVGEGFLSKYRHLIAALITIMRSAGVLLLRWLLVGRRLPG